MKLIKINNLPSSCLGMGPEESLQVPSVAGNVASGEMPELDFHKQILRLDQGSGMFL